MEYDDDNFCRVLRPDAPEDVKEAYKQHCAAMVAGNGYMAK